MASSAGAPIAAATPAARAGTRQWRAPLREALDGLRDNLAGRFEETAGKLLKDPWAARDDYIDVLLDRSERECVRLPASSHSGRDLNQTGTCDVLKLLEMQRHAMLMYTSCGWFFDELSGIETVQVIQYAGRAIQLARETSGIDLEPEFIEQLALARSNLPELGDGALIYNAG